MRKLGCLFFVFYSFLFLKAQEIVEFENLSLEKGITENIIYSVQQDSIGNIWMATDGGVVKYNSHFSVKYNKYRGFSSAFGNRVNTVFVDSKNNIWVGSNLGIYIYNNVKDSFEEIESKEREITIVKSIIEDRYGNIWIGDVNGVWVFDIKSKRMEFVEVENGNSVINIQCLWSDNNRIIVGTTKGLYVANIKKRLLRKIEIKDRLHVYSINKINNDFFIGTKSNGLFKVTSNFKKWEVVNLSATKKMVHPIRCITKDKNSNYYIGTDGDGIYYVDPYLNVINHYIYNQEDSKSLSINGVYDLFIDKENILWVATYGGGINYLDKRKSVYKNIQHEQGNKNSLNNNFTKAIEVDAKGKYWFGTNGGLSVLNKENNKWSDIESISDIVLTLEADGDYIWVGTFKKGLFKVNIHSLKTEKISKIGDHIIEIKSIYTIFKDSKANIWIGGNDQELVKISKHLNVEKFRVPTIRTITELKDGSILCGSVRGVSKINIETGTIEHLHELYKNTSELIYLGVNAMVQLNDEEIALATYGQGILIYNLKLKFIKELNIKNGLPSDIIQSFILLNNGDLWAGTSNGLAQIKLSKKDTVINVFDKEDGLPANQFNYGSCKKINDNLIAFGGVNGVTIFNPKKLRNPKNTPQVVFDEFSVNNEILSPEDSRLNGHISTLKQIKLNYNENAISFGFSGVLHSSPNKVNYSWKMDGYIDGWSKPSEENIVNLTNLSPGNYTFSVKAANKYGTWGEVNKIKIIIGSPWWATYWAYFGYLILIIIVIYLIIYVTKFYESKKIADEQVEFFNNLTHEIRTPLAILLSSLDDISTSNNTESKSQAKKTISRMNALFDQMLNFKKATSFNNVPENIRILKLEVHVKGLIENFFPMLEQHDIDLHFVNNWKKEVFYFDKEILNKIFFNLISNAVKYTPDGGEITIKLDETQKGELLIEVTDTGIGIPEDQQKFILNRFFRARNVVNSQKPGTGLGLMLVKKIVEKTKGTISFKSKENKGTSFFVKLTNQQSIYKNTAILEGAGQKEFNINEHLELKGFKGRKILIVEDNNELRKIISKKLGSFFKVYEASNGKEGFEKANDIFPDIILTDLIMPVMDGLEMSKKIFDDIKLNHIPVFMMTVLNSADFKIKSIESGIAEYIEKPIDLNLLLAKITNYLSWQNKLRTKFISEEDNEKVVRFKSEKDKEFIKSLELILNEHIGENSFSVFDLCEKIGMSRTSLYMKLKSVINLSPQEFIINTRLKFAKNLLLQGKLNISQIAYQSGFSNPKYFSTSFKKYFGENPSSYIKNKPGQKK